MRPILLAVLLSAPSLAAAQSAPAAAPPPSVGVAVPAAVAPAPVLAIPPQPEAPVAEPRKLTPEQLEAVLRALDGALGKARADLGVPVVQLPPEFWRSRRGQALAIGLTVGSVIVSSGLAAATVWAATR